MSLKIIKYKKKAYKKGRKVNKGKENLERNKLVIYVVLRDSKRRIMSTLNPKWKRILNKTKISKKVNNQKKGLTRRKGQI